MDYYSSIKELLINNEITKKAKDYSKNRSDINARYNVGKLLYEAGKHYGEGIIRDYSKRLIFEVDKQYNERTLRRIRQLYILFDNQKWSPLATKLSYSHYVELLPFKDINKIKYYIYVCEKYNLSRNELRERIKNKEYERLDEETRNKIINKENVQLVNTIKDPILVKNSYDTEDISECMLQKLILENIEDFLIELGEGYSFIRSEYKIKIGNRYNYIDMLLYNIKYNCYVVIELKVTELKKEHIGQIEVYMNYIDEHVKDINQNKTIGIIIVKENNKFVIRYRSDDRIVAREYELI